MSRWSIDTPLEALDCAIFRSQILDRYIVRPGHQGTPGAVVADMPTELRELLQRLRSEHMLALRDDAVWPRVDVMNEHQHPWRSGQVRVEDVRQLMLEFDRRLQEVCH